MDQAYDIGFRTFGAGSDNIVDCFQLAHEAWGDRCDEANSGILPFAYLWRRFGPPWYGCDDHKDVAAYILTTADSQVFLTFNLKASGLGYSMGYLAHESIRDEADRPMRDWHKAYQDWWLKQHPEFHELDDSAENREKISETFWSEQDTMVPKAVLEIGEIPPPDDHTDWRKARDVVRRVNQALYDAMKELERPVYVRDCAINIFGRCDDTDDPAQRSRYAGYGIPKVEMDKILSQDDE